MSDLNRRNALYATALADLAEDFEQLGYLCRGAHDSLVAFRTRIDKSKKHLTSGEIDDLKTICASLGDSIGKLCVIATDSYNATQDTPTEELITTLTKRKHRISRELHALYGIVGSTLTATEWQSPSWAHTTISQAGIQTGSIVGTINDYKRDQHLNALAFEEQFKSEYIHASLAKKPFIHAFATSSGMAAFTTILNYLVLEHKADTGPVVVGKSCYFECKQLLTAAFGSRIIEVDEADTQHLLQTVTNTLPSAIFLDSLTNTHDIARPHIMKLIETLKATCTSDTYLVIDNSCMGPAFQPLTAWTPMFSKLRIIVFESLNKYHQFGLDRTTAGIIWCAGFKIDKLFDYREHLGTNISDSSVSTIPVPNYKLLSSRLDRLARNATVIATKLSDHIAAAKTTASSIIYPGLPSHPQYTPDTDIYNGPFLTIRFKPAYSNVKSYNAYIKRVLALGKKRRVNIVAGTSFGLSVTRIYLTALHAKQTTPFIRIAAGTEDMASLENVVDVLRSSL